MKFELPIPKITNLIFEHGIIQCGILHFKAVTIAVSCL